MAIAFNTTSSSSSKTWSHTCTGTNMILFVMALGDTAYTTAITYNGVSMTLLVQGTNSNRAGLWYILNPSTGANNIIATSTSTNFAGCAISYTGVNQSTPDSSNTNFTGFNITSKDLATTVVAQNSWLVAFAEAGDITTMGRTSRLSSVVFSLGDGTIEDSNSSVSTGSVSTTFSFNSGCYPEIFVVSIAPFVQTTNGDFFAFF